MRTTVDEKGNTSWHLTKAEITVLLAHMARDAIRPALSSLVLNTEKGRAWSTDGHRAALAVTKDRVDHDRAAKTKDAILVPRKTLESVTHLREIVITPRLGSPIEIAIQGDKDICVLTKEPEEAHPRQIDQVAPQIGAKHVGVPASFNGSYLADTYLIVKALPMRETREGRRVEKMPEALTFYPPTDKHQPVTITASSNLNSTEWTVLLMPIRK
jgi:hypothetical protein